MNGSEREIIREIKRRWAAECEKGELFCFLCGKKIESMKDCNADHWVPRSLGGKTDEENLKPACIACNSKKGCIPPDEFLLHKDEILKGKYHPERKNKNKKIKEKEENKKINLGDTIYYIQNISTPTTSYVAIKRGEVLGYVKGCVLVKEFYTNKQNVIESRLIVVAPLTKEEAYAAKAEYDKQQFLLFQNQIQR